MAVTAVAPASAEDELDVPDASAAPPKKRGSKKLIIITILGALALLLGVAAGLHFMGMLGGNKAAPSSVAKEKEYAYLDLPGIVVNISSTPGQKFLHLVVSLELDSAGDVDKIKLVMPRVIDQFQVYLRELRLEDIKGASGMHRMHEELLTKINEAVAPIVVSDILFKEVGIQ
jgi:flagellar FliL protein